MRRFLSDILLPFPNSNDLNSHDGAYNNLNKKMIIQVDTNYKPYYVNQESKDNKKHIQFQTKYNLVTADHYSVYNCNKTGS